jgi:hypothetical protein
MSKLLTVMMLLLTSVLGACESAKPFDYEEFNKRPGIFTGKDGNWVVHGK